MAPTAPPDAGACKIRASDFVRVTGALVWRAKLKIPNVCHVCRDGKGICWDHSLPVCDGEAFWQSKQAKLRHGKTLLRCTKTFLRNEQGFLRVKKPVSMTTKPFSVMENPLLGSQNGLVITNDCPFMMA